VAFYCQNFNRFLHTDQAPDAHLIAHARCKMWSCEYCAEMNRRQWRARIYNASAQLEEKKWSFITITAHSKCRTEEASLKNLRTHWEALRKRLKRRYGKFHFVRVYEKHKSGAYHIHALLNFEFDDLYKTRRKRKDGSPVFASRIIDDYVRGRQRTKDGGIKRDRNGKEIPANLPKAASRRLGYIHHAENMQSAQGASKYITKYMTKGDDRMALGIRRIQCSQGFPKSEAEEQKYKWSVYEEVLSSDLDRAMREGKPLLNLSTKKRVTTDDFIGRWRIKPSDLVDAD